MPARTSSSRSSRPGTTRGRRGCSCRHWSRAKAPSRSQPDRDGGSRSIRTGSAARSGSRAPSRIAPLSLEKVLATAREFAVRELRPVALAYDESEEFPRELLDGSAGPGLTCDDLPAAFGGGGLERLEDQIQVIEELTWGDSPIALVIAQGGFFAAPVLALGTEEQKRRWLPRVCAGEPPACAV